MNELEWAQTVAAEEEWRESQDNAAACKQIEHDEMLYEQEQRRLMDLMDQEQAKREEREKDEE